VARASFHPRPPHPCPPPRSHAPRAQRGADARQGAHARGGAAPARQDRQIDRRAARAQRQRGTSDHRLDARRGALLLRERRHRHSLRGRHRAGEIARSSRPDARRLHAADHPRHTRGRRRR